jgi:hypothetical protein
VIKCFVMSFIVLFSFVFYSRFVHRLRVSCVYIFLVCALSVCRFTIGIWQFFVVSLGYLFHCVVRTGNGLVVPSSSHKREVAGLIPAGCTKTFLSPLPLLPHRLTSYFDIGRHLSIHKNPHKISQQQDKSSTRPHGEKKVLPLQSTGEERKEEINSTVQLVTCQYWYKL